jgi:leucyl aminopeptidase (aminopeptidase T)
MTLLFVMPLNLTKLLEDVFQPSPDDNVVFLVDQVGGKSTSRVGWGERLEMSQRWSKTLVDMGIANVRLGIFDTAGVDNAELPLQVATENSLVNLQDMLAETTLVIAMTGYSITAPLLKMVNQRLDLRAASMPGVRQHMELHGLSVDHNKLRSRTKLLCPLMNEATRSHVKFSTGDEVVFDLRHRTRAVPDCGECHRDHPLFRFTNLPSGESFITTYAGEKQGCPSQTEGTIPFMDGQALVKLRIKENWIVGVEGESTEARKWRLFFDSDRARCNIAEYGLGCNDKARVTGAVIEDEKAGFHWAFGRNDHFFDGTVGPADFLKPENVVHTDIVYAPGCPITIDHLSLESPAYGEIKLIEKSNYIVW